VVLALLGAVGVFAGCHPIAAKLKAIPDHAATGERVTLDATESQPFDSDDDTSRWDLDGDGLFESEGLTGRYLGQSAALIQHASFPRAGVHHVGVDLMTESNFLGGLFTHDRAYADVTVTGAPAPGGNQPPVASFTYSDPQTPSACCFTERPISFNAAGTDDPDGHIVKYQWDWTSNGIYHEYPSATASHTYGSAGTYYVTLRVTDDGGAFATTTRAVNVSDDLPKAVAGGLAAASARRGARFSLRLLSHATNRGRLFAIGKRFTLAGLVLRGRTRFRRLPRALGRNRRARWAARLTVHGSGSGRSEKLAGRGLILFTFSRRSAVCMEVHAHGTPRRGATGRAAVVGGRGRGAHLAGGSRIRVRSNARTLSGRLALRHAHRAHRLGRACRALRVHH
jgi:hypothetical protein